MIMTGNTRLVYLTPTRLRVWRKDEEKPGYCYTPMCSICRKYIMYEIAIIRGGWRNRRKYICLPCATRVYPKRYLKHLIEEHMNELGTQRSRLKELYRHAKAMVEYS